VVVRLNVKLTSTNMISAVPNSGKVRISVFDGTMNADILIDYCTRLIRSAGRKVYLIAGLIVSKCRSLLNIADCSMIF